MTVAVGTLDVYYGSSLVGSGRKCVGNVFVGLNMVDSNGNTSKRVYKLENASGDLKMRGGVWSLSRPFLGWGDGVTG